MSRKSIKMLCVALVGALLVCVLPAGALAEFIEGEHDTPCMVDLDGDGAEETVAIMDILHEDGEACTGIEVKKGAERYQKETDVTAPVKLYLSDVDGDGLPEILLSGDECSDDYITYCWKFTDGKLVTVPFEEGPVLDAGVLSCEHGVLYVFTTVNALGTYTGFRSVYYENGVLGLDGETWRLATDAYTPELIVKQDIYVLTGDGGDDGDFGEETTLAAGTTIYLTATDGRTMVSYVTPGGSRGTILLEEDEWGSHTFVNGMPEEEVFAGIEYAD